jgi:hypothetical protein
MNKARKGEIYEDFDENFCNTFNRFYVLVGSH